eukprot:9412254-Lingulodinium_polyedra.AAC.1
MRPRRQVDTCMLAACPRLAHADTAVTAVAAAIADGAVVVYVAVVTDIVVAAVPAVSGATVAEATAAAATAAAARDKTALGPDRHTDRDHGLNCSIVAEKATAT